MKFPIYGKIKHVPNHQPVKFWYHLCRWNLNNISIIWIMVSQLWCSSSARHILNHPKTIRARVGRLRFIGLHRNEGFWDFGRSNPIENLLGSWNFLRILLVTHIFFHEKRLPIDDLHSWSSHVISLFGHLKRGSESRSQGTKSCHTRGWIDPTSSCQGT